MHGEVYNPIWRGVKRGAIAQIGDYSRRLRSGCSVFLLTLGVFHFALLAAPAQTNTICIPREMASSYGSSSASLFGGVQFLQLYSQAEFADLPADVIQFTSIAFRWDERYEQAFERVIDFVILRMGIFDSGRETYYTFEDMLPNPTVVYEARNVHFAAPANRLPNEFHVMFPLQKPFVYDRRLGSLGLRVGGTPGPAVDSEFDGTFESSWYYSNDGMKGAPYTMITKFFYVLPPLIDSIQSVVGGVEINFTSDPTGAKPKVESAPAINGPFTIEERAVVSDGNPGMIRAFLPESDKQRFYRIRTE